MENKLIGGSQYFLIFEDNYRHMGFVYFLKVKDDVFDCFKNVKAMEENQKHSKIKILRSDNGDVFCSCVFKKFLITMELFTRKQILTHCNKMEWLSN